MDKIYRVFISSTYEDLIEERREVTQALLEMNCFPTGMELFQASNDTQWDLIKKVIDSCDYYVVIVAGRYGSIHHETKKSYTQMEYEYALNAGIPVLGFIRRDLSRLPNDKVDNLAAVNRFIKIITQKEVKYWSNAHELAGAVSRAMHHAMEDYPRVGWVRDAKKSHEIDLMDAVKKVLLDREVTRDLSSANREPQVDNQEKTPVTTASSISSQTSAQNKPHTNRKNLVKERETEIKTEEESDREDFSLLDVDPLLIKYSGRFVLNQMKSSALRELANITLSSGIDSFADIFEECALPGLPNFLFYKKYNTLDKKISIKNFSNVVFDIWGNRISGCIILSMPDDVLMQYYIYQVKKLSLRLGSRKEIEDFKRSMTIELGSQFSGSCTTALSNFSGLTVRMGKSDSCSLEELFDSKGPIYVGSMSFSLKSGTPFRACLLLDV